MSEPISWCRSTDDRLALEAFRDALPAGPVVLVHDYLVQDGGAERVLGVLADAAPAARLQVLVADHGTWGRSFHGLPIETTFAQRLLRRPAAFRRLLPVYPFAASTMTYPDAALVLSSSSAFVHAARAPAGRHLCYCYTPMRFAYDTGTYLLGARRSGLARVGLAPVMAGLRRWDRATARAGRIDRVVGISRVVQERIAARWGRESGLVFPPVDVARAPVRAHWSPDGPLVIVARLLAYKRIDLAVRACTALGRPLLVIGSGPDRARLEGMAGPSVRFLGRVDEATLTATLSSAAALLFPGEEDFGIAPVEAMAVGTPVVALGAGGALDTVGDAAAGVLFGEPTVASLQAGIETLLAGRYEPEALRRHADRFSVAAFLRGMASEMRATLGPLAREAGTR